MSVDKLLVFFIAVSLISVVAVGFREARRGRDREESRIIEAQKHKEAKEARTRRIQERREMECAEARRRQKRAGFIEGVVEHRYMGSKLVEGAQDVPEHGINCCVLVLRAPDRPKIALYVETRGDVRAMAVYAMAEPGTRLRFPAGNIIQSQKHPVITYGTFFERDTWTGTKGADQIEFLEEENEQ